MKTSFMFSGSGGQGIMSAGITLAQAAIDMGKHATYLPEYGPEQRGGSARCTVVISDDKIISPLPTQCDNLVVMNAQAYSKCEFNIKQGGLLLVNSSRITDGVDRDDVTVVEAAVDDIALELGSSKAANIILLGILAGATGIVTKEILEVSLKEKFAAKKPGVLEMNIKALERGFEIGIKYNK